MPPTHRGPAGPPGGWRRPTVAELQALDGGAPAGTAVPAWLNQRGGFPSGLNGEVWASPRSGNNASTVNQSTGAVNSRPITDQNFSLVVGPTVGSWYWLP